MSDTELQAAMRRWRMDPSAENALVWARLQNRTQTIGPSVADAFGSKDVWGKRTVRVVSKAMVLLHGFDPPRLAELSLSEVARLSKKQWRYIGDCGPVTLGEICAALEANGLAFSDHDDPVLTARQNANVFERAGNAAAMAALREERDEAVEEMDDLLDSLVAVRNERDAVRAALVAVTAERDEARKALARIKDRTGSAVAQVALGGSPSLSKAVNTGLLDHVVRQAVGAAVTRSSTRGRRRAWSSGAPTSD